MTTPSAPAPSTTPAALPAPTNTQRVLDAVGAIGARVDALEKQIATAVTTRVTGALPGTGVFKNVTARRGEDIMTSRGMMFSRILALRGEQVGPENCKIELMTHEKLKSGLSGSQFTYNAHSHLLPLWPEALGEDIVSTVDWKEIKDLFHAGTAGADPQEAAYWQRKTAASPAAPSTSWVDQSLGGSFVSPPDFGAPIDLLRNREVMLAAGASIYPLGPSGQLRFPRLTQATQGGWLGENAGQTPTVPQTGALTLRGKKVFVLLVFPNEILRFANPAIESVVRSDMMKTASLIMDKGLLDGPGSDNVPLGLINTPGIGLVTPTTTDKLAAQDAYSFRAAIELNNATPNAFVMRPDMFWKFPGARWTPYSAATNQGGFVYDPMRPMGADFEKILAGLKVITSPQVTATRGTGAQTYVLCGDFTDFIIGMFGAIEFAQTDGGINLFGSDQTAVRAILTCDGGAKHPGAFAWADHVNISVTDS